MLWSWTQPRLVPCIGWMGIHCICSCFYRKTWEFVMTRGDAQQVKPTLQWHRHRLTEPWLIRDGQSLGLRNTRHDLCRFLIFSTLNSRQPSPSIALYLSMVPHRRSDLDMTDLGKMTYPLVICYIAIENGPLKMWVFPLKMVDLSIAFC